MYNIFLGDLELYGIEEFSETSERDVEVHSTLGVGAAPLYGDKDLRSWSISCELTNTKQFYHDVFTPAADIFATFEAWLTSGEEQRLVVVNGDFTLSEMVLLKSYKKPEKSQGVYDVTIELLEYKEISVRTADLPYIQRPGKMPPLPVPPPGNAATLTDPKDIDAAFQADMAAFKRYEYQNKFNMSDFKQYEYSNQAQSPNTSIPYYLYGDGPITSVEYAGSQIDRLLGLKKGFEVIGKIYDEFNAKNIKSLLPESLWPKYLK